VVAVRSSHRALEEPLDRAGIPLTLRQPVKHDTVVVQEDVLAFMAFPREHRTKICSANPLERVNGEIKCRTDVVGIFPNEAAVVRLVGAILLEQNDEWAVGRRYMSLETLAPISDAPNVSLPAVTA